MKTKGLTIQEAIKSGFLFKREGWIGYRDKLNLGTECNLSDEDILATDWQIKVPEVTITREKLAEAWDRMVRIYPFVSLSSEGSESFEQLAKELGL